jgi:hypothetical protein
MKERFAEIDRQASELNVEIQAMEAQLVAIENYYRVSRSEQKIRPEDIRGPVRDMRATIEELRGVHEELREAIADARRDATAAGGIGEYERETTKKLSKALQQETEIARRAAAAAGRRPRSGGTHGDSPARRDAIEKQPWSTIRRSTPGQHATGRTTATWPPAKSGARTEKLGAIMKTRRPWAAASRRRCSLRSPTTRPRRPPDVGIIDVSALATRRPSHYAADQPEEHEIKALTKTSEGSEEDK